MTLLAAFFAPTVLDNVTDDMKIMQEEIFWSTTFPLSDIHPRKKS